MTLHRGFQGGVRSSVGTNGACAWTCRRIARPRVRCSKADSSSDATSAQAEGKEQLARVASALVSASKAVFLRKLASYTEQLKEVEGAGDKNFVWKAVNGWTERLLRQKIETCYKRLSAILAIESSVLSCTLDGACTFRLRATADQSVISSAANKLQMTWPLTPAQFTEKPADVIAMLAALKMEMIVDKEASVAIPPLTWDSVSDAEDLQEALLAGFSQVESLPGTKVELRKTYGLVDSVEIIGKQSFEGMLTDMINNDKENTQGFHVDMTTTLPFAESLKTVANVAVNAWLAGLVGWVLRCDNTVTQLHWSSLVPVSFAEAQTLLLWTLPLAGTYALLALMRDTRALEPGSKRIGPVTAVADALQTASRVLPYSERSPQDDVRIMYFLATVRSVLMATPWVYVLLPTLIASTGVASFGKSVVPMQALLGGSGQPATFVGLLAFPMIALVTGAFVGVSRYSKEAVDDMLKQDSKSKDGVPTLEDVFQVSVARSLMIGDAFTREYATVEDPKKAAELIRQELEKTGCDSATIEQKVQQSLNQPPNVITMDFASASQQLELEKQAQWIVPTAVTFTTFYLCMEALFTGQATAAAITEILAIIAMDSISTPWKRCSMQVHVEVNPVSGVKLGSVPMKDMRYD